MSIHGSGTEPFLRNDLLKFFSRSSSDNKEQLLVLQDNLAEKIMQSINKESLLGKLQTAFYRIRQVDERQRTQSLVYSYLSGGVKRRPSIQEFPFIDNILRSDLCTRFVSAISMAKKVGADKASDLVGIDRFEIAYVLKRSGYEIDGNN